MSLLVAAILEAKIPLPRTPRPGLAPPAAFPVAAARTSPAPSGRCVLFHVDMDCFYVSVEVRDKPALRGRPVAVCPSGNANGTSEVASASYEARAFGIRPRMLIRDARALCPDLICLPCDYKKYEEVSTQLYKIFTKYTQLVQAVSADEAFLDMTVFPDPEDVAQKLRAEIMETTGCPASVGISHNKMLARIATDKAKPNGQFYLRPHEVDALLAPLPVSELPGVGPQTAARLQQLSVRTVGELKNLSKETLQRELGPKTGEKLYSHARGVDDRPLEVAQERKSVGTQISWGVRFAEPDQMRRFLEDVAREVSRRMTEIGVVGRRLSLKLKRATPGARESIKVFNPGQHTNISRSGPLPFATAETTVIAREAYKLFLQSHIPVNEIRGVGLQVEALQSTSADQTRSAPRFRLEDYFHQVRSPPPSAVSAQPTTRVGEAKDAPLRMSQAPSAEEESCASSGSSSSESLSFRLKETFGSPKELDLGSGYDDEEDEEDVAEIEAASFLATSMSSGSSGRSAASTSSSGRIASDLEFEHVNWDALESPSQPFDSPPSPARSPPVAPEAKQISTRPAPPLPPPTSGHFVRPAPRPPAKIPAKRTAPPPAPEPPSDKRLRQTSLSSWVHKK